MWLWHKDRYADKWNRIKSTKLYLYIYPGCQDHSKGKEWPFQQMVLERLDVQMQKNEFGLISHHIQKLT